MAVFVVTRTRDNASHLPKEARFVNQGIARFGQQIATHRKQAVAQAWCERGIQGNLPFRTMGADCLARVVDRDILSTTQPVTR